MSFVPVYKYQPFKSWPFTYHMYAYLVQIAVVKYDTQPSNNVNYFKMFYVVVNILTGQLQAFLIKYNHNTMVEIDHCLYRVLHCNILVHFYRKKNQLHHHIHAMQYFTLFYLMIPTRMLLLDFVAQREKSNYNINEQNMGKH